MAVIWVGLRIEYSATDELLCWSPFTIHWWRSMSFLRSFKHLVPHWRLWAVSHWLLLLMLRFSCCVPLIMMLLLLYYSWRGGIAQWVSNEDAFLFFVDAGIRTERVVLAVVSWLIVFFISKWKAWTCLANMFYESRIVSGILLTWCPPAFKLQLLTLYLSLVFKVSCFANHPFPGILAFIQLGLDRGKLKPLWRLCLAWLC